VVFQLWFSGFFRIDWSNGPKSLRIFPKVVNTHNSNIELIHERVLIVSKNEIKYLPTQKEKKWCLLGALPLCCLSWKSMIPEPLMTGLD
jgi:hypothetical protein